MLVPHGLVSLEGDTKELLQRCATIFGDVLEPREVARLVDAPGRPVPPILTWGRGPGNGFPSSSVKEGVTALLLLVQVMGPHRRREHVWKDGKVGFTVEVGLVTCNAWRVEWWHRWVKWWWWREWVWRRQ